jgi:hypothetical protein
MHQYVSEERHACISAASLLRARQSKIAPSKTYPTFWWSNLWNHAHEGAHHVKSLHRQDYVTLANNFDDVLNLKMSGAQRELRIKRVEVISVPNMHTAITNEK